MVNIEKRLEKELGIKLVQVQNVIKLLDEGNTVPFIARYRKEQTGALSDDILRKFFERLTYLRNLKDRKEDVLRLIDEQGKLTEEIVKALEKADSLTEVEDIYRPFKPKKRTRATIALEKGLKPLADIILAGNFNGTVEKQAEAFINEEKAVNSIEDAIAGALDIIAEGISDDAALRKYIRNIVFKEGKIETKGSSEDSTPYEMYYDYSEDVKYIKPHRVLAVNRGEKEGVLSVSLEYNKEYIYNYLEKKLIKDENSECAIYVKDAIVDSYKRLIGPSVEREIRSELTEKSEEGAIEVFAKNLENYLLTPPMKDKMILGLDPAYRTGCKLAVIDYTGQMLDIKVIYPHEPKNDFEGSKKIVLDLIDKYNIDVIAIGNGTASRESETFIANVIKDAKRSVSYIIVNEAGASVYSASKLAIEEFPNLHVEERSAISIARRLQDPLSELVKIDSKSIGVGQYQHDVKEKNLNEALDFVVSKSVNNVGVNINTASASILKYISGLTKKSIEKIIDFRNKHGRFNSRNELIDNKILSAKAYEQSIGFMRVLDGSNPLDKTSIHPESYDKTTKLLESIGMNYDSLGTEELISKLDNINIDDYSKKLDIDIYTLEDIINSLKKPNRDPRDDFDKPILKSDVLHIEDLKKGMELEGTVRNVVDFGAFIDIGIKNDGLVHISKITDRYIKHPSEVLSVGDIVTCYVDEVFLDKGKVALSLIKNDEK